MKPYLPTISGKQRKAILPPEKFDFIHFFPNFTQLDKKNWSELKSGFNCHGTSMKAWFFSMLFSLFPTGGGFVSRE